MPDASSPTGDRPVSGAAMDRPLARRRIGQLPAVAAGIVAVAGLLFVVSAAIPRGLAVSAPALQIAPVTAGEFRDEILLRASAVPLESVMLDAVEAGRVEAVMVRDGAMVKQGDLLFRLSNVQREQELVARTSEVAQQMANAVTLRAAQTLARSEYRQRISVLEFDCDRARKSHKRNEQMAAQDFISAAALEESLDKTAQCERLLAQTRKDAAEDEAVRAGAIAQLDQLNANVLHGLALIRRATEALSVRAPATGRLTGFNLDVGASVKSGDRLGRIDSPDQFKLLADVDEYYLGRVATGLAATSSVGAQERALKLTRVNSQVKDRRFEVELGFTDDRPVSLQFGQTVDLRLALGRPENALTIPEGAFFAETGGAWIFVVSPDQQAAERRPVRLGRRSSGRIEVLQGLQASERVIVSSYADFGDAQRLRLQQ